MKIYVAHSRGYDYQNELYIPIRNDKRLEEYNIILPHEFSGTSSNDRDFYRDIDLMIAECSYPATGLGIELGWAYDSNIPVYCIHKQDMRVSGSVHSITENIYGYSNTDEMLEVIDNIINMEKSKIPR